ncbi:5'-nucleotidase [Curtobacterium sp. PhB142]|uniref:bifunctional metallophosphatase/5'-nucleotidase n=1 Tax=unclassified Curtobacterium TaxID=257496 RepID=UPI001052087A|nr:MULTISPECIES: bifunctional UDP-sugar hydrolase/5'-nucleotidase [unclassified Curtobacterium]TCL83517.1 5'-nucleotidase [Curtobacterium sp. PhB142]TCM01038.1 5'-nucleotidase [Curtobacterium sp. PhB134]
MNLHSSPRRRRRITSGAAFATAGVLVALSVPSTAVAAEGDTTIDIIDVNDFHGRIESEGTAVDKAAGAAELAGVVQSYREANPNTIFASVGDNVGASTFTSLIQQDAPTIDALNAMDLDVSAIGNHELDKGQDDLTGRIEDRADWPYVSANIVKQGTTDPAFEPYSIVEKGGVKVGFIGATTEDLIPGLVSPGGVEGLAMAPIVSQVNKYADQLTDGVDSNGEADVLVLLVHEGAPTNALADATGSGVFGTITSGVSSKVSAIVSAHTHATYNHQIAGPDGTTRPVIQTGSYGVNFGHLQLTVDADKQLTGITSEVKSVNGETRVPADSTSVDAVADIVTAAKAVADVEGSKKLGEITGDLRRAVQSDRTTENRGGESVLGNYIAEVQRSATVRNGSQIAFMNPGGLRTDMVYASSGVGDPDGTVTYKEAALVQPFANTLVTEDMTGQQIKDALEQQWQPDGLPRPFLKLGVSDGFAYTYDPAKGRGERITGMTLNGESIALDDTLKVTVNSFLSTGGDNFAAFATGANIADSGQVDLQAQVDYFLDNPTVTPPSDQRAVGTTVTPTPEGGFQPGDEITIDLSSLVFSSDDPAAAGTVSVSAGDVELATAEIDPTIVDTNDEQGRATLTFAVPTVQSSADAATVRTAARAAAATDEPLVVTLPGGQTITLAVTIPLAAAVDPTDPTEPTDPTDPTDPADPGAGNGDAPGAGNGNGNAPGTGTGTGTGLAGDPADSTNAGGDLAYTGADLTAPGIAAGLLLLAGITALVAVRRKRARTDASVQTD